MIEISNINNRDNRKKSNKLPMTIIIISIIAFISILLISLLPYLLNPYTNYGPTGYTDQYPIIGSSNLSESVNVNDSVWQNITYLNVNSSLTETNQEKTIETDIEAYYSHWNSTHYVLSYSQTVTYPYNDSFINYVYFDLDLQRSGTQNYDIYFWNFTSDSYEFNLSYSGGYYHPYLDPDHYHEGEIKYKVKAYSSESYSVIRRLTVDFNFTIYSSDYIILYGEMGTAYKNFLDDINWTSPYDILKMSIHWCNSSDNSSWFDAESASTFSGEGDRYLKLNISVKVFRDEYYFNLNVTYQNCSYYYFNLNKTVSAYQSNSFPSLENKEQINFNFTSLIIKSTILTNSELYLYNYSANSWHLIGGFSTNLVINLNFTHYIDNLQGIQVKLIANASIDFTISYNFQILFYRPS